MDRGMIPSVEWLTFRRVGRPVSSLIGRECIEGRESASLCKLTDGWFTRIWKDLPNEAMVHDADRCVVGVHARHGAADTG